MGLSITSLYFAGINVMQIALIYITEVEIGPFIMGGYSFPAIYTFRIFLKYDKEVSKH